MLEPPCKAESRLEKKMVLLTFQIMNLSEKLPEAMGAPERHKYAHHTHVEHTWYRHTHIIFCI